MAIGNTVNDLTDAVLGLHAMLAIVGHNVVLIASATLNTCVWACLLDEFPVVEVVAGLGAGADTWIVRSAAIALNWTELLVTPVNVNTMSVTLLSIGTNGCTETLTVSARVTSTSVKDTVFVILGWVDMSVTSLEQVAVDNGTLLDRPDLSVWVRVADVNNVL